MNITWIWQSFIETFSIQSVMINGRIVVEIATTFIVDPMRVCVVIIHTESLIPIMVSRLIQEMLRLIHRSDHFRGRKIRHHF